MHTLQEEEANDLPSHKEERGEPLVMCTSLQAERLTSSSRRQQQQPYFTRMYCTLSRQYEHTSQLIVHVHTFTCLHALEIIIKVCEQTLRIRNLMHLHFPKSD